MTTTNYAIPSEAELEGLANALFPDFEPERCAAGIANLANGDTSIAEYAAAKTAGYAGGTTPVTTAEQASGGYGSISEFAQIADAYNYGYDFGQQTDSFGEAARYAEPYASGDVYTAPQEQPASGGYTPVVLSQGQADSYVPKQVKQPETPDVQRENSSIIIGPKTLAQIRSDFPILGEKINGHDLVWLDNGATTQRPKQVIDRLSYYYEHENSNVHRGAHELAARSTDAYENARQITADFLGAPSKDNIVFVRGTTEAINLVANAYVKPLLQPGDEIILTMLEHHANIVPWQLICEETGAVIKVVPVDKSGQLIISEYEKLFTSRTKFVATTHVSNVLGTVTPIEELVAIAHRYGVRILIDGAQSIAHIPVNVSALDADFFVFSGHKVFAPTGIGAVYGKKELLDAAKPYHGGGNMIADVTFERTIYNALPNKFEAGTGSIADAVGLGAALSYLSEIGMPCVYRWEHELLQYALREMATLRGVTMIGTALDKASAFAFKVDGYSDEEIGKRLDEFGIAVRTGHHCAQPVLRRFGYESAVRPTLALYNSPDDIDALVKALRSFI